MISKQQNTYQIIINWDPASMWRPVLEGKGLKTANAETIVKALDDIVDEHAKCGVDILVHCVFTGLETMIQDCKSARTVREGIENFDMLRTLDDAGIDFIQTIMARCATHGIPFYAGMRMNDRHMGSGSNQQYRPLVQKLIDAHPECELKEFPGGLDYKYDYVREALLAFIEEFLGRYDVDGLEFDWPRWCHIFKASEAAENAPCLTDFTRKTRAILNAAAERRGCDRLPLGVRVAQTMDECVNLGYDVAIWVTEGLVDYICPSDFFYTDFNARTEEFVDLARNTTCKIYPSIHPLVSWQNSRGLMGLEEYRAAAKNFYAYGAHGVSPYNYQYHWAGMLSESYPGPAQMWPKAMGFLADLKSADSVAAGNRRYLFHPLWSGDTEGHCPTWGYKNDRIQLDRSADDPYGTFTFRMAEDLTDENLSAVLAFKVTYMIETDELEVTINGQVVPADRVETEWRVGQSRADGRPLGPHVMVRLPLTSPPAKFGDNELGVRLTNRVGMAQRMLNVQEFEIDVSTGSATE